MLCIIIVIVGSTVGDTLGSLMHANKIDELRYTCHSISECLSRKHKAPYYDPYILIYLSPQFPIPHQFLNS